MTGLYASPATPASRKRPGNGPRHLPAERPEYLLDVFGNLVPIYDDPEMSCFTPILLKPRPVPPVLPVMSRPGAVAETPAASP